MNAVGAGRLGRMTRSRCRAPAGLDVARQAGGWVALSALQDGCNILQVPCVVYCCARGRARAERPRRVNCRAGLLDAGMPARCTAVPSAWGGGGVSSK